MKINEKNTALSFLDGCKDDEINIPEPHVPMTEDQKIAFGRGIMDGLRDNKGLFRDKVQYISKPFFEAYNKGKHKLVDVFDKEDMKETGTFIWQFGSFTFTNFYYLKTWIEDGVWKADYLFIQFSKHSQNDFKGLDVCISGEGLEEKTFIWKDHYDGGATHTFYLSFLVSLICFIKYVELETKVIEPKKKDHHVGVKYVNETNRKIEILDSTWFTTIIRNEGFEVSGHFKMQPYGIGLTQRKLKWIPKYEKSGYTRTAKILQNQIS